ncbi:uncharacterized protein LOC143275084 [Babylonia areolata]|uniref:uncharacterized protein LOC143275084 n=1 Tax=Babylonia areolata TaxID=304850 RepID=UPI003FD2990B
MAEEPARVAWRTYHDWVLPVRAVQALLAGALLFLFLGLVLLAVGGGTRVSGLVAAGAVLAGVGGCGMLVCLLLCLHAYFIFNVRDQANQTTDALWSDEIPSTHEIPGYAIINKPSALKSADTLRRNGGNGGIKKVTMAPDVALKADVRAPALRLTASDDFAKAPALPRLALGSTAKPENRTVGSYAIGDAGGNARGARMSGGTALESFDQMSFAQQQQFQDVQQQRLKHQQASQHAGHRQLEDTDIHRQRQQLELQRQHLSRQQQHKHQQQLQQQPHHIRVQVQQPSSAQSVTYAQVQRYPVPMQHSPSPSMSSQQSSVFTSATGSLSGTGGGGASGLSGVGSGSHIGGMGVGMGTGSSVGTTQTSSSFSSYKIQTQGLQYQSGRPYQEDDDYDNPAEGMPMLARSSPSLATSVKGANFSGSVHSVEVNVPEPAPLQYPSARRPMTFEQQSSSKMSIYDNVSFPYAEVEGE